MSPAPHDVGHPDLTPDPPGPAAGRPITHVPDLPHDAAPVSPTVERNDVELMWQMRAGGLISRPAAVSPTRRWRPRNSS